MPDKKPVFRFHGTKTAQAQTVKPVASKLPTDLVMLNRIIPTATPAGAYCAGLISAIAFSVNESLPERLIEIAIACPNVDSAVELWRVYKRLRASGLSPAGAAAAIKTEKA